MVRIALLYTFFAVLAVIANLGAQHASVLLYGGPFALAFSMCVGTAVGLVLKYVLDKRYIFNAHTSNLKQSSKLFTLYTVTGLATTALFWGVELSFHHLFGTHTMRYIGGALGLALGYIAKYQLDKAFVFTTKKELACNT